MRKVRWLRYNILAVFILISYIAYQKMTDDTYKGMSIIPEQRKDIPMYKGLKPTERQYNMKDNHWGDI